MQIPSSFIKVSSVEIKDYRERSTDTGELLMSAFLQGPSKSVREYGEIKVEIKSEDSEEQSEEQSNNDSQSSGEIDSSAESSDNGNSGGNESLNYSIFNSYYNIRRILEADDTDNSNNSDDEEPRDQDRNQFTPGGETIQIRVLLKNNGCTIWNIQINKDVKDDAVTQIRTLLINKKFKDAFNIACRSSNGYGFVVLSASTYINKNDPCHAPYMGYCRYGFDAGTKGDASDHTVCIAIAPLDAKTMRPSEKTVFTAIYDITGDISGGAIDKLKSIFSTNKGSDDEDRWSSEPAAEKSITDDISKYLHDNFETSGSSDKFDEFTEAKKFVSEKLKEGSLRINSEKSTDFAKYHTKVGSKLIHY